MQVIDENHEFTIDKLKNLVKVNLNKKSHSRHDILTHVPSEIHKWDLIFDTFVHILFQRVFSLI